MFLLFSTNIYAQNKIKVVTTIIPLSFFIEQIGGDRVEVESMISSGVNPHSYEPAPKKLFMLSKADIYFKLAIPNI